MILEDICPGCGGRATVAEGVLLCPLCGEQKPPEGAVDTPKAPSVDIFSLLPTPEPKAEPVEDVTFVEFRLSALLCEMFTADDREVFERQAAYALEFLFGFASQGVKLVDDESADSGSEFGLSPTGDHAHRLGKLSASTGILPSRLVTMAFRLFAEHCPPHMS